MLVREPIVAGTFYGTPRERCLAHIKKISAEAPDVEGLPETIVGGIVPHAGWDFSGAVAMQVFAAIKRRREPRTFVLFGAVHRYGIGQAAVFPHGIWRTPIGEIEVDERLAAEIVGQSGGLIVEDPYAHAEEHSIEVQVPLIQHLFSGARIVPIAVPPGADAHRVGYDVACIAQRQQADAVFVGSTDLTHYGPNYGFAPHGFGPEALEWVKGENDKRMLDVMTRLEAEAVCIEAQQNHNACGAGAVAATLAAAREMGSTKGHLLAYTTSSDVMSARFGETSDSFVGYAGVVF
ncbi:MAG: AmmeMemoRadiSam system protein B [Phycisphaerae bacterium]|jgi:hypothetical protein|nr:AmmeMemoRadiSam system protein B [Phycisphaerae bacterium]